MVLGFSLVISEYRKTRKHQLERITHPAATGTIDRSPQSGHVVVDSALQDFGGDQIQILPGSQRNEIYVNFYNITGGALRCSFWVTKLREWTADLGYLRKSKAYELKQCTIASFERIIEPKTKFNTHITLVSREKNGGMTIPCYDENQRPFSQRFSSSQVESYWTLTVEVRIGTKAVTRKNVFFKCPSDKRGFELTIDHELGTKT